MELIKFIVTNVIKLVQDAQIQEMIIVLAVQINIIYQFLVIAMDVILDVIYVLDMLQMNV